MPRSASVQGRLQADVYATRVVLIELLKMLQLTNPGTIPALRTALAHNVAIRPDDVPVLDHSIREAAELIFGAVQ